MQSDEQPQRIKELKLYLYVWCLFLNKHPKPVKKKKIGSFSKMINVTHSNIGDTADVFPDKIIRCAKMAISK